MKLHKLKTDLHFKFRGQRTLYHGTRHLSSILKDDELARPLGGGSVHLTSCPAAAARSTLRGKHQWPGEDGRAAIIALDHVALEQAHGIDLLALNPNARRGSAVNYYASEIYPVSSFILETFWLDDLEPGLGVRPILLPEISRHSYAYPARAKTLEFMRRRAEVSLMSYSQAAAFANDLAAFLDGLPWHESDRHHDLSELRRWLGVHWLMSGAALGNVTDLGAAFHRPPRLSMTSERP